MSSDPSGAIVGGVFGLIFLFYAVIFGLAIASFVFWIIEIIDVARREFPDPNTKVLWLLIVILLHGIGALIYYFVGKPQGWLLGEAPKVSRTGPPPGTWPPPPGY